MVALQHLHAAEARLCTRTAACAELKSSQLRLEAHRLQQQQQEQQVTDKGLLCQRAREGLQRKIGIRKDPYSVLLALRIPIPADSQPRNIKVGMLSALS